MYLTGLCWKNSIMDNALVPDQATDWSISLKPGSYTGDTKLEGNSAEFTFAKSSGIVTKDREKDWPIADRRDPSNNPRNNRGSNFFSEKIPFSFLKRRITTENCSLLLSQRRETFVCILSAFPKTMPNMFRWFLEAADWGCVQSLKPIAKLDISYHWLEYFGQRLNKSFSVWWQVVRNSESGIDVFHPSWLCNELVTLGAGGFVEGHSVLFN